MGEDMTIAEHLKVCRMLSPEETQAVRGLADTVEMYSADADEAIGDDRFTRLFGDAMLRFNRYGVTFLHEGRGTEQRWYFTQAAIRGGK
jgi:hypothetical protein